MPRRRVTIAALMLLVLFAGLVAALVRSEVENRRLRLELLRAHAESGHLFRYAVDSRAGDRQMIVARSQADGPSEPILPIKPASADR